VQATYGDLKEDARDDAKSTTLIHFVIRHALIASRHEARVVMLSSTRTHRDPRVVAAGQRAHVAEARGRAACAQRSLAADASFGQAQ